MRQQGAVVEHGPSLQALDRCGAERTQRGLFVDRVLGDVNVHTRTRWAPFGDLTECGFGKREAGVQPEHSADARVRTTGFEEAEILVDPASHAFRAVPVRDLVTQHRRQTRVFDGFGQQIEAAVDTRWRGVVVEHRGTTLAHAIRGGQQRRDADRVRIERPIETPPEPVEDLREVAHGSAGVEPACQCRVEVVVQVHQAREDEPTAAIEKTGARMSGADLRFRAHGDDAIIPPRHRAPSNDDRVTPAGEHVGIAEDRDPAHAATLVARRTRSPSPWGPKVSEPSACHR